MSFMAQFITASIEKIYFGNLLLMLCFLSYLIWWVKTFSPVETKRTRAPFFLFIAFVSGITAMSILLSGMISLSEKSESMPVRYIIITGIFVFFVLLAVTRQVLNRPVTSELFIIHLWTVLVLSMADTLYGNGYLNFGEVQILMAMIAVSALISIFCYLIYYKLEKMLRYYVGMIPLALACCLSIAFLVVLEVAPH